MKKVVLISMLFLIGMVLNAAAKHPPSLKQEIVKDVGTAKVEKSKLVTLDGCVSFDIVEYGIIFRRNEAGIVYSYKNPTLTKKIYLINCSIKQC